MRTTRRSWLTMATVCTLAGGALTACGGESKVNIQMGSGNSEPTALAEGDVRVRSTDGALILAVIGDSVHMQLSDSLRNSVTAEVKNSTSKQGDDIGSTIANAVGGAVSGVVNAAMGMTVRVPAENVENLRYEDGHLRFEVKGSNFRMTSKSDDAAKNENGGAFSEEDAMRFIQAVNNAQARRMQK